VRIANHLADVFLQFTIIGDEALDGIVDFAQNAVDTTVDLLRAADTTDVREAVACALYCRLKLTDSDFTQEVKEGWILDILGIGTLDFNLAFSAFVAILDLNTWRQRARSNDENEGDCDACECDEFISDCPEGTEWLSVLDFTVAQGPVTGYGGSAWTSGQGWNGDAYGSGEDINFHVNFTAAHVLRVQVNKTIASRGGANNASTIVVQLSGTNLETQHGETTVTGEVTDSYLMDRTIDLIYIDENTGDAGGNAVITQMTICGTGTKPSELP